MIRVLDTRIDNERKPRTDLVGGACRVRVYVPGYNIVVGRVEWSSSHARFLVSFQVRE